MQRVEDRRRRIERKGRVREFVFGIQDGLISTVGLLAGVQSATDDARVVVLTGVAAGMTGALSMATGSWLSTKAEKEIFEKELSDQEALVADEPYLAKEGLTDQLEREGLDRPQAYRVVRILAEQKRLFVTTFQEKVLGLGQAELSQPLRAAMVMYLSFVLGSAVSILPYFFLAGNPALAVSVGAGGLTLFLVGVLKGWLADRSLLLSGLEFLAVALGSAALGYGIGLLFRAVGAADA